MCEIGNEIVACDKQFGYTNINVRQIACAFYRAFLTKRQAHLAEYGKNRVRKKWKRCFNKRFYQHLNSVWNAKISRKFS